METFKKQFDRLLVNSLENHEHINFETTYYDEKYKSALIDYLKKRNLYSSFDKRELPENNKKPHMLSVASSSRLCCLYFQNRNIVFEKGLSVGVKSAKAQLDAFDESKGIYYECKCHEFFDKHQKLRKSYQNRLSECFGIHGQIKDEKIELSLQNFGIDGYKSSGNSIYELHFDMKQLICHLLGLEKNGGGKLQYILFTPSEKLIKENVWCLDLYEKLHEEIQIIWNSPVIKGMINKADITLCKPLEIEIQNIDDFVLSSIK